MVIAWHVCWVVDLIVIGWTFENCRQRNQTRGNLATRTLSLIQVNLNLADKFVAPRQGTWPTHCACSLMLYEL